MSLRVISLGIVLTGMFSASAKAQGVSYKFDIPGDTSAVIQQESAPVVNKPSETLASDVSLSNKISLMAVPAGPVFLTSPLPTSDAMPVVSNWEAPYVPITETKISGADFLAYSYAVQPHFALFAILVAIALFAEALLLWPSSRSTLFRRKHRRAYRRTKKRALA